MMYQLIDIYVQNVIIIIRLVQKDSKLSIDNRKSSAKYVHLASQVLCYVVYECNHWIRYVNIQNIAFGHKSGTFIRFFRAFGIFC